MYISKLSNRVRRAELPKQKQYCKVSLLLLHAPKLTSTDLNYTRKCEFGKSNGVSMRGKMFQ